MSSVHKDRCLSIQASAADLAICAQESLPYRETFVKKVFLSHCQDSWGKRNARLDSVGLPPSTRCLEAQTTKDRPVRDYTKK